MIRDTSIAVYHQIKDENLLSRLRWEVYDCLYHHGPLTQMETCRKLNNPNRQDRSYMPRFAELHNMGVIKEVGQRVCSITGREVLLWDVTNSLPRKLEKDIKPTRQELINALANQVYIVVRHTEGKVISPSWTKWLDKSNAILDEVATHYEWKPEEKKKDPV